MDSFAISMPLLEFHEFRSKCANGGDSKKSDQQHEEDNYDDDEDFNELDDDADFRGHWAVVSDIKKNPEHAVKRHPFVVTRCVRKLFYVL